MSRPAALPPPPGSPPPPPSEAARVRRIPGRARYDVEAVHAVLDAGRVAHVGVIDGGRPVVVPMAYGRQGERLILHGSKASRLMRGLAGGADVCVTVTLLDGLVLARSAFHHSMNYRSAMVLGTARAISDDAEARAALDALVEHLVPGRTADARAANAVELRQTLVVEVPIEEASVKARTGGPVDDEVDLALRVWAGVVPLSETAGAPEVDAGVPPDVAVPGYVLDGR